MRTLLLAAGLAGALSLSACGSPKTDEASAPAATTPEALAEAATEAGKSAFASCAVCHNNVQGAGSKMGPNLYDIVGRKAGIAEGYTYSAAMKASGITWTEAELDAYLAAPTTKVAGTKMGAGAVSDADKRTAIIAYLKETAA